MSSEDIRLIAAFSCSVVTLVILIARYSLSPFVALIISSVLLALASGLELSLAWEQFAVGVGSILGSTAIVIGLGAMIGVLLLKSGGATMIAEKVVGVLGVKRLGWTLWMVGLLVGVGVWFTVGLVLLVPITLSLSRVARVSILVPAMSMLAGLSAMHGLTPPHPGPLVAINLLQADMAGTILWSLIVGAISAAVAGPMMWRWFDAKIEMPSFDHFLQEDTNDRQSSLSVWSPLVVILLPIGLMLLGSIASNRVVDGGHIWIDRGAPYAAAMGNPTMAMLVGFVLAYLLLGIRSGFSHQAISEFTQESLYPVANVLLVVGAGAGFSKVLIASGVGEVLAGVAKQAALPTLVLGWLIAAAFRVATGSATTAITAAGGIMSVMVANDTTINRELLVLALGAGSLTLSHVNDGGFWFVKELFTLTVAQTLKTWTVLETVLSLVALAVILIINSVV